MKKHAASHGLAVLVCTVVGGILMGMGRDLYPALTSKFESFCSHIATGLGLDYSPKAIAALLLAIVLAIIWGVAFSFMHSDGKGEKG